MPRALHSPFTALALLVATVLPTSGGASVSTDQEWSIGSYEVTLSLLEDGRYEVTERIVFDFRSGTFTFGTRTIPVGRMDSLVVAGVESPDMGPLELSTTRRGGELRLRWEFAPRSEPGEVVIRYTVHGAIREGRGRNEIFWAAIGDGWEVPMERARVTLRLPTSFTATTELRIDPEGEIVQDGDEWVVTFPEAALAPEQGYHIRASFPQVMAGNPTGLADSRWQVFLVSLLLLGVGTVRAARAVPSWRSKGERRVEGPPEFALQEAAILLHGSTAGVEGAIPATLLQLSRDGFVRLVRGDGENAKEDEVVRVVPTGEHPRPLTPFEAAVLDAIRPFEVLKDFVGKGKVQKRSLVARARSEAMEKGWLRDRTSEANVERLKGGALLFLAMLAIPAGVIFGVWHLAWGAALFSFSLPHLIRGARSYALTEAGVEVQEKLLWWLRRLRGEVERTLVQDPAEAATRFSSLFPWFLLDPEERGALSRKIGDALKEIDDDLPLPAWAEDRSTTVNERWEKETAAYAAFATLQEVDSLAIWHTVPNVTVVTGNSAAGVNVAAFGAAGAGAAGGGGGSAG